MREIADMTKDIVERIRKGAEKGEVPGDYVTLKTRCPRCGSVVRENYRRFACTKCEFSITKHPGSRFFEIAEVEELLREKKLGPLTGFRSKIGRPFAAALKLVPPDFKLEFDFGNSPLGEDGSAEPVDFTGQEPVGPCPKCRSRVFEMPMAYVCEKSVGPERTCDFRSGKVILQQPIERTQMAKLLNEGKTELLRAFVSNKTRRKFSAYLVRQPDGKVGFEFEPRPAKKAAKSGAKTAANGSAPAAEGTAASAAAPARRAARTAEESSSTDIAMGASGEAAPAKAAKAAKKSAGKTPSRPPARPAAKKSATKTARKR
jgi:DNA topoisomerase-3